MLYFPEVTDTLAETSVLRDAFSHIGKRVMCLQKTINENGKRPSSGSLSGSKTMQTQGVKCCKQDGNARKPDL